MGGLVVFAVGAAVLYGWMMHSETLVIPVTWSPLMVANTAFTALLVGLGVTILSIDRAPRSIAAAAGGIAAVLALLTVVQWSLGLELGIDDLLVKPFTAVGQETLGRMSPHTANTLTMLGLAVAYLAVRRRWDLPLVVPAALAAVSMAIAVTVLVGYLVEYRLPLATTMAVHTASCVAILGLSVLALVHVEAIRLALPFRRWAAGPILAFAVLCPLLTWFGFIVRDAAEGRFVDVVQMSEVITFGMTAFVVATTVASHLAVAEHAARAELTDVKNKLQDAHDTLEQRVLERTSDLDRHREHLRALSHQLVLAEQRERRRMAGELHDYLAQMLVVARMKLLSARERLGDNGARPLIDEATQTIDESLAYARTLMAKLSPTILFEQGLVPALHWLAGQDHGLDLEIEVTASQEHVPMTEDKAVLLYQSVRELVHNVAKHAEVSRARVEVVASPAGDEVTVCVVDAGSGFDPEAVAEEAPTSTGQFGLFNIRERLEVLGGSLELRSSADEGTVATLWLPLPETVEEPASPPPARSAPAAREPVEVLATDHRRLRVMLVDDHRLVREGLRMMIEQDCRMDVVAEAADGAEALDVVRTANPDAVLMDVNMPRMDGVAATRELRKLFPELKILAVTMADDQASRKAMREAGADGFVSKSAIGTEICDRIDELLTGEGPSGR